jgi:hypothetical protein
MGILEDVCDRIISEEYIQEIQFFTLKLTPFHIFSKVLKIAYTECW